MGKLPGGGITTLDLIIRRLMGLNRATLVTSFITSVVSGLVLIIASTSTTRVYNDSSVKLLPLVFSNGFRIE